jgi:hypothetical protein
MSNCENEFRTECNKSNPGRCCPGELCSNVSAETDLERNGANLLTVRAVVNNVEPERRVALAVVLLDCQKRVVAFKGFTVTSPRGSGRECECVTITRTVIFVLPDDIVDDISDLKVRVIANYIFPCD